MRPLFLALILLPALAHADPPAAVPAPVLVAPAVEAPPVPLPAVVNGQLVDACTACASGIVRTVSPSAWDKHSRWVVPLISIVGGALATTQAMAAAGVFRAGP